MVISRPLLWMPTRISLGALGLSAMPALAGPAFSQPATIHFNIPATDVATALNVFITRGRQQVIFKRSASVAGQTNMVHGNLPPGEALRILLRGSGFEALAGHGGVWVVRPAARPSRVGLATSQSATRASALLTEAPTELTTPDLPNDIVVTAQKRSQNIQKVPATITAIGGSLLEQRGAARVFDLQSLTPSLQVGALSGDTNVTIRGVGNNLFTNSGAPGVAINVDGVFLPIAEMGALEQVDMARVEVLEGPQGTLYGRNANAGAINFITNAPTDRWSGYAQAGYASYERVSVQGVLNAPIAPGVNARAMVSWDHQGEGFVSNILPGGKDVDRNSSISARLRIAAELAPNLKLDVLAAYNHATGPVQYYTLRNFPNARAVAASPYFADAIVPLKPRRTSTTSPILSNRDYSMVAATLNWSLGRFALKSITGWQQGDDHYLNDNDGTNVTAYLADRNFLSKTFTQEINVNAELGSLNLVAGGFYMNENYRFKIYQTFPLGIPGLQPGSLLVNLQSPLITDAKAVFGDATWNVTERLNLLGGVRYSSDRVKATQFNYIVVNNATTVTCPQQNFQTTFHSTTYRAGAQYDLSQKNNLYFTTSTGFKDGGFNRSLCGQSYKPETVTAYEIGTKNRFLDNRLVLNISAFYYDYTNLQLIQTIGLASSVTNAGTAKVKGVEVQSNWQPNENWSFNASLALLDAKYTKFLNTDTLSPELGVQNLRGNYLNNAPKETANLGGQYRTDELEFGYLTFRGDITQRCHYYLREFNLPLDRQNGYALLDLSVMWESAKGHYRFRAYATNVTDKAYIPAMGAASTLGARFITWNPPRQIGVELRSIF